MAKKLTKSARIRRMLERGNTVKQITAALGVSAQMVYQIRSADKKKAAPKKVDTVKAAQKRMQNEWVMVTTSKSKKPIGIPKDVYDDHMPPLDYYQPKRSLWARFKSWLVA